MCRPYVWVWRRLHARPLESHGLPRRWARCCCCIHVRTCSLHNSPFVGCSNPGCVVSGDINMMHMSATVHDHEGARRRSPVVVVCGETAEIQIPRHGRLCSWRHGAEASREVFGGTGHSGAAAPQGAGGAVRTPPSAPQRPDTDTDCKESNQVLESTSWRAHAAFQHSPGGQRRQHEP